MSTLRPIFVILLLLSSHFLNFGAYTSPEQNQTLNEWRTKVKGKLDELKQNQIIYDQSYYEKLEHFFDFVHEMPSTDHEFSKLKQRMLAPLRLIISNFGNIIYARGHYQNSVNDGYVNHLKKWVQGQILALDKEFGTLLIEMEIYFAEKEWDEGKNLGGLNGRLDKVSTMISKMESFCAKDAFECAKLKLDEQLQSCNLDDHQKWHAMDDFVGTVQVGIFENELSAKIGSICSDDSAICGDCFFGFSDYFEDNWAENCYQMVEYDQNWSQKMQKTVEAIDKMKQKMSAKLAEIENNFQEKIEQLRKDFNGIKKNYNPSVDRPALIKIIEDFHEAYTTVVVDMQIFGQHNTNLRPQSEPDEARNNSNLIMRTHKLFEGESSGVSKVQKHFDYIKEQMAEAFAFIEKIKGAKEAGEGGEGMCETEEED